MKRYDMPEIEIIKIDYSDVITTSPGTSGPVVDEDDGSWGVGIGL